MSKQKHNLHPLHVRIPLHLLNKIESAAVNNQQSISKVVRLMIENS